MTTTFITAPDVAGILGISYQSFLRRRAEYEARLGFPTPMPHTSSPLKWRADQVTAWVEAQGRGARTQLPAGAAPNVVLMAEARRA